MRAEIWRGRGTRKGRLITEKKNDALQPAGGGGVGEEVCQVQG